MHLPGLRSQDAPALRSRHGPFGFGCEPQIPPDTPETPFKWPGSFGRVSWWVW